MKKFLATTVLLVAVGFPFLHANAEDPQAPAITCWSGISPPRNGWAMYIKSTQDSHKAIMYLNTAADGGTDYDFPRMNAKVLNENPIKFSYDGVGTTGFYEIQVELQVEALMNPGVGCLGRSAFGRYNDCEFRGTLVQTHLDSKDQQTYVIECNRQTML